MARGSYVMRAWDCPECGFQATILSERATGRTLKGDRAICPHCQVLLERQGAAAPRSATVVDDVLWGGAQFIENLAPTPIWVETKSAYRALMAAHGMSTKVHHVPVPGTDKSPHTQSWNVGLPKGVDPRPYAFLSPAERVARRQEAADRLGMTIEALADISDRPTAGSAVLEAPAPRPSVEFFPDRG